MSLNTTFVYQINVGELAFNLQTSDSLDELPEGKAKKNQIFHFLKSTFLQITCHYGLPAQTTFARLKTINHVKIYLPTFIKRLISPKEN